jgi:hypothetical protein
VQNGPQGPALDGQCAMPLGLPLERRVRLQLDSLLLMQPPSDQLTRPRSIYEASLHETSVRPPRPSDLPEQAYFFPLQVASQRKMDERTPSVLLFDTIMSVEAHGNTLEELIWLF